MTFGLAMWGIAKEATVGNIRWWAFALWPVNFDSRKFVQHSSCTVIRRNRSHCSSLWIQIVESVIHFTITILIEDNIARQAYLEIGWKR